MTDGHLTIIFLIIYFQKEQGQKNDVQARQFYEWCQGKDWEKIVDLDTEALLQCAREKRPLFHKSLKDLRSTRIIGRKQVGRNV